MNNPLHIAGFFDKILYNCFIIFMLADQTTKSSGCVPK